MQPAHLEGHVITWTKVSPRPQMIPAAYATRRPSLSLSHSPIEDFGAPRIGKYKKEMFAAHATKLNPTLYSTCPFASRSRIRSRISYFSCVAGTGKQEDIVSADHGRLYPTSLLRKIIRGNQSKGHIFGLRWKLSSLHKRAIDRCSSEINMGRALQLLRLAL